MQDLLHAFPGQEEHEPVYVFARPYPLAFLPTALVFIFVFLFGLGLQILMINNFFTALTSDQIVASLLAIGLFNLFVVIVFLIAILDFYFDIVIVTDRRVVDIDQEVLFYRKVAELDLEQIEDVSSINNGFLATVFNYGQVEVQTAGSHENFIMNNVRYPREISAIALNLSQQSKKDIPQEQRVPQTVVIGVINNRAISNLTELQSIGAILPDDFRLVNHAS